jgi:hypothetical protein
MRSTLRATSFAPVALNPVPTINNAVDVDPDFFEGATLPGEGPGPHFITVSFIKNVDKIRDQLLKALSATVTILAENKPGVMIHCIQKDAKLPPLSSALSSDFPSTGVMAQKYMFIPNAWSLQPGTRNQRKLPMQKLGRMGMPYLMRIVDMMVPIESIPCCGLLLTVTSRRQSIIYRWSSRANNSKYVGNQQSGRTQRARLLFMVFRQASTQKG